MSVPRQTYLFFLTDSGGRSYFVDNGTVKSRLTPTWLPEAPEGWIDTQISFARSTTYYGLNRSFVPPVKFAGDGATIIRFLFYTEDGVEQKLFLNINKWNDEDGIYQPYYKGGVDLSKIDDDVAVGVTVNLLESGLLQLLKSNEKNVFEIPCDGSDPSHVRVSVDGILFDNTVNYELIEEEIDNALYAFFIPGVVFLNNDGTSFNTETNGQQTTAIGGSVADYYRDSDNYLFRSSDPLTVQSAGTIQFQCTQNDIAAGFRLYYRTSTGAITDLFNTTPLVVGQVYSVDMTAALTLAASEKLYLGAVMGGTPSVHLKVKLLESAFSLKIKTKFQTTECWGIPAIDLFKQLVLKTTDGKYTGSSSLLNSLRNLVIVSGQSLRQIDKAVIKTCLYDFFQSFNAILNGSMGVQKITTGLGEELFFEKKRYVYNPDTVTLDIGEVSDFHVTVNEDLFFNTLKVGYPDNSYDNKSGNNEYNTTAQWSSPITKITKNLDLISKYRADSYGVEYTRYLTPGNNTVNNKSDNDVFILNIDTGIGNAVAVNLIFVATGNYITAPPLTTFRVGMVVEISGTANNNRQFTVTGISNYGTGQSVFVAETVVDEASIVATITYISGLLYPLKRVAYDSITGIDNPDTAYNIEMLTPKRMMAAWGNFLRGVLHNHPTDYIKFLSIDKNKNLATVKGSEIFIESSDQQIGQLDSPLLYPYQFAFKTKVPLTFEQIMTGAANGHIRFTYNGQEFFFFPTEVSVKPTLNDTQEWKGIVSPSTSLEKLLNLDINGLNFVTAMGYSMFIPHLNPVQFVPLGITLPAQYHYKNMDQWWYSEGISRYVSQPAYAQKWQTNDLIELQLQTNGLGPVKVELLDCSGTVRDTVSFSTVSDPAVITPQVLYQATVSLSGYTEGLYYLLITAGTGETIAQVISEPLHIAADHPETMLLEYSNSRNKQACIFSSNYLPNIRFEGWIDSFKPESTFTTYVNQPADIQLLNGIPHRSLRLNIGSNAGIPDYVADKVNRILLLTSTKIDGVDYTRDTDAKMESVVTPGTPLKYWSIVIRPAENRDGLSVSTDGTLDGGLTVVYNINTKSFGDGSGQNDNTVQVTDVD